MLPVARIHLATVDSTNAYARANFAAFDAGALTVVSADEQTAGRGRGARAWASSADDIKLTFAFRVPPARVATAYLLSPLLSLAAVRALARAGVRGAGIKWPNDVVLGGARKVGGVLCEMEGAPGGGGGFFAALGIGLNVNSTPAALGVARAVWPLTTLRAEAPGGAPLDAAALADALVGSFRGALAEWARDGWAPFRDEYAAASVLLGRRVRFAADAPGAGAAARVVEGVAAGFRDDGALLLDAGAGAPHEAFLAGEVAGIELADGAPFVEGDASAR